MIDVEYTPAMIERHRNDLRKLYQPVPASVPLRTNRQRLGTFFIRLGERVGNLQPELIGEAPIATTAVRARA